MKIPDGMVTVAELADRCKVTKPAIRNRLKQVPDEYPPIQFGKNNITLIPEETAAYIAELISGSNSKKRGDTDSATDNSDQNFQHSEDDLRNVIRELQKTIETLKEEYAVKNQQIADLNLSLQNQQKLSMADKHELNKAKREIQALESRLSIPHSESSEEQSDSAVPVFEEEYTSIRKELENEKNEKAQLKRELEELQKKKKGFFQRLFGK